MRPAALLETLRAPERVGAMSVGSFRLLTPVCGSFLARGPDASAALLVPLRGGALAPGRVSGSLALRYHPSVLFELDAERWEAPCASVECSDDALLPTFCVLALDLAERLTAGGTRPSGADVGQALAEWERLLRRARRLTENEELGLWGELYMLSTMGDLDAAVAAWAGPFGMPVDFFRNGVGVECKTTTQRLCHHVSRSQTAEAGRDAPVYLVSLWVASDPGRGKSVAELAASIGNRVTDPVAFERALLAAGHSPSEEASTYGRFALLERPLWFAEGAVPQVRHVDPGIRSIRYVVELDEVQAMEDREVSEALAVMLAPPGPRP